MRYYVLSNLYATAYKAESAVETKNFVALPGKFFYKKEVFFGQLPIF